jgi:hypothetical protein
MRQPKTLTRHSSAQNRLAAAHFCSHSNHETHERHEKFFFRVFGVFRGLYCFSGITPGI